MLDKVGNGIEGGSAMGIDGDSHSPSDILARDCNHEDMRVPLADSLLMGPETKGCRGAIGTQCSHQV